MKIAFDISDLATNRTDGTTRYTYELGTRLPTSSPHHQWHYVTPSLPSSLQSWPQATNVHKHLSPFPKYWTQARLPWDLLRLQPDVLFMPIQQLPYLRPHLRTVATVHDLAFHTFGPQFTYKDWLLLHIFTAYVARRADHIIAVSKSTAADIAHYYGRTKNVHVIHHGVDHAHFRIPTENERHASWQTLKVEYPELRKNYLLFVGQIQPRKNLGRLIEAFEFLHRTHKDMQLVIAGSHGWLQQPTFKRINTSPLRQHILLTGRVPDDLLPALYWHARVFVLPSRYEGFGMPLLEAQACGCPVVTSNVSSMPEVVGDSAVLIDPLHADSIAAGIAQALANSAQLQASGLTNAGRFTWEACAEKTLNVLSD